MEKEFKKGIRKAIKIVYKYLGRTEQAQYVEVINDLKELIGEKPISKRPYLVK